ncbi:MAG TPA: PAS domain-containing protein, partial [Thermoanaerobaculia bacterium]
GDKETLQLVSSGFAAIAPKDLKRIDDKWFGHPVSPYGRYLGYAGYVAAAALLIIFALFIWNRVLGRKIMERTAALAESEQRFRQIAENIREVFWLAQVEPRKPLYASPAYEAVVGRSMESLYKEPLSFFSAVHPDDRNRVFEAMETEREKGFEIEYRLVRPDGTIRWVWDRGFPIRDAEGRVYRIAGIAEDITERKLAVEAAMQAEDRIRTIIDTIPGMVWCTRPDGMLVFINQRWLDYTGIPREDALTNPNRALHPDDLPNIMASWQHHMAGETAFEEEMRLRRYDGEYRWFLVRTVPFRDASGAIVNWYGTSTDIEDRKRAEGQVSQREQQLNEAQRIAHVGSWNFDLRTFERSWSDECCRIFGAEPGAPDLYDRAFNMIHPDDVARVRGAWERAITLHEAYEIEYRIIRGDDGERTLHSLVNIEHDENDVALRVVGTTQDVTELRRAEDQLKSTSEQLRALSASVQSAREEEGIRIAREIHDELGATLTSLRWDLESIRKKSLPPDELREKLTGMLGVTDTMIGIVRRIASDLRPPVLDVLGLEEALEWQARQFENRTGIAVTYESSNAPDIELDPVQSTAVFRIFQEALTNVLRHARATRVDVTVAEDTGAFVLKIGDNGRGITESERVGERSIGLLGMRERAHLIGGQIEVTGIEGERTTVTLRLPLSA